jgi:hypothetical protein
MNAELGALSNFSLPEYYFRVYREPASEGGGLGGSHKVGGKFFSRIERIAWGDM